MILTRADFTATRTRRLTLILIAVISVVLLTLIGVMFYLRYASEMWPVPFHFGSLLMVAFESLLTICAALSAGMAWHATNMEDREPAVRWLAIAVTSWLMFLFLEIVEWVHLVYIERLGPDTSFGSTFLALTGVHWVLGIFAAGWFTFCVADVKRRDIFAAILYSSSLAVWWLILVVVLYVPNADLYGF